MKDFESLAHVRWECKYHVIFIPKYRRKVIYGKLRTAIGEILRDLCKQKGIGLLEGHAVSDHVHLCLSIPPKYSVAYPLTDNFTMKRLLLLSVAAFCCQTISHGAELAREGATAWRIVLPDEPSEVEKTAAQELSEHLTLATGAGFETIAEKDVAGDAKSLIFVGRTSKAPKRDYRFDEILIKMDGGNLILAGHERRGCLYAVYSFLQDVVGVRWWTPDATFAPKKPTLAIADDLDISYAPPMISREVCHSAAQPCVFSARMKGNGNIRPEYGGRVDILNFVHTFYTYLPPEKYFDAHPEWYSEVDGKRTGEHAQLCLTNDAMVEQLTKNVLEAIRKNPGTRIVDVSQNDWGRYCTCPKCKALDDAEESNAGTLVAMVNRVAEAVEREYPDVLVETLAYRYTRKPPKTLRPRDNVLIRLCTIECSFVQPLDGPQNAAFAADMEGWSKLAKQLFIWDYTTNYSDYIGPHPNLHVLGPNIRYFVDHGVVGLLEEAEGDDFCELKNWVLLRMMWNPKLDPDSLIDEFLRGYYGEAIAPMLRQYWNLLTERASESGIYLGWFGMTSVKWLDLPTLNRVTEILNQTMDMAAKTYGPDSAELRRLEKSKLGIDHVWLSRYWPLRLESRRKGLPFLGPSDPVKAVDAIAGQVARFGLRGPMINQEDRFPLYFQSMKDLFLARNNPPEVCRDVPEDAWIACDALIFSNDPDAATIVGDPAAWNGKSVRMGTKVDWSTSYAPAVRGRYRVLASLRCEGTMKEGKLGTWGVYDPQNNKHVKMMTLAPQDFLAESGSFDPKFRWIDLGIVDFQSNEYVWFAHGHSPELDAIFVDRIVLIDAE